MVTQVRESRVSSQVLNEGVGSRGCKGVVHNGGGQSGAAGAKGGRRVGGRKSARGNEDAHFRSQAQKDTAASGDGGVNGVAGGVTGKVRDSGGGAGIKVPHGKHRCRGTGEGGKHGAQVYQRRGFHRIQARLSEACTVGAGQWWHVYGDEVKRVSTPAELDS